jgi:tripartite-type tricarboxylate transporter receptor subunit TctC
MKKAWPAVAAQSILFAACAAFAGGVGAQSYPSKPIRFIVPYPPGGVNDIVARSLAPRMTELGQPLIVENRGGAAGMIGSEFVAKAAPDGYTILMGTNGTHAINAGLYPKMSYDTVRDFAPVVHVSTYPLVLVANPSLSASNVRELIALAKSKPGEISFASAGNGSAQHLSGELFKGSAGVDITHIPYKGSGPALTDIVGGQVSMMFDNMVSALPHVKAGKLRALAVTTARRAGAAPDIPTMSEAGMPGFLAFSWNGVLAPAATPRPVVDRLNAEVVRVLRLPEVRSLLVAQGAEPVGSTPDQFAAFIRSELDKMGKVIRNAGVKPD